MYRLNLVKQPCIVFSILVLCAMIGPLSIDLFTPSLPAITRAFATTAQHSQWTVSIFMLGFAISMLIVGPISERLGHRRTLLAGYTLFLLATLAILITDSIEVFIAARLVQAVFGCFGTALSRALARDIYKDEQDIRILGMINATMMVAPMVAPAIGGLLQQWSGWQASFLLMAVLVGLTMVAIKALPGKDKVNPKANLSQTLSAFTVLIRDHHYLLPALTAALAFAGAFVFVVGAPFVLIDSFALTPHNYGMIFGLVMGAYILTSAGAGRINNKLGRSNATRLAWLLLLAGASVALVSALITDGLSLTGFVVGIITYEAGLGLLLAACQAKALGHLDHHGGTGAGMIFFLEMVVASGVSYISGLLVPNNTLPLAGLTMTMAILAGVLSLIGARKRASS